MNHLNQLISAAVLAAFAASALAQTIRTQGRDRGHTRGQSSLTLATLPMADKQAFDDAKRGLIEALGEPMVMTAAGPTQPGHSRVMSSWPRSRHPTR